MAKKTRTGFAMDPPLSRRLGRGAAVPKGKSSVMDDNADLTFVIKKTKHNQFRVTIVAANGETLFTSEAYTRKAKADKVINILTDCDNFGIEDKTR